MEENHATSIVLISEICHKYKISNTVKEIYGINNDGVKRIDNVMFLQKKHDILINNRKILQLSQKRKIEEFENIKQLGEKHARMNFKFTSTHENILDSEDTFLEQTLVENINCSPNYAYNNLDNDNGTFIIESTSVHSSFSHILSSEHHNIPGANHIPRRDEDILISSNIGPEVESHFAYKPPMCSSPIYN